MEYILTLLKREMGEKFTGAFLNWETFKRGGFFKNPPQQYFPPNLPLFNKIPPPRGKIRGYTYIPPYFWGPILRFFRGPLHHSRGKERGWVLKGFKKVFEKPREF